MLDEDEIREQELTTDDVLDRHLAEPQTEVEWVPEWDEDPDVRPGENCRIEDGVLIFERKGFEARIESYETTHWKVDLDIPETVGEWYPREIDLQCHPRPEHGFIRDVETEDYFASQATLIIQANRQPVWEVEKFIDELAENAQESAEFRDELSEKLAVARENEEKQKQARTPGWSEEHDAFVCPHCKETSNHVSKRDDGGADCVHCGESVDEYVESENED
jgi:hypothetical protein